MPKMRLPASPSAISIWISLTLSSGLQTASGPFYEQGASPWNRIVFLALLLTLSPQLVYLHCFIALDGCARPGYGGIAEAPEFSPRSAAGLKEKS
jgi:hypothetical protein